MSRKRKSFELKFDDAEQQKQFEKKWEALKKLKKGTNTSVLETLVHEAIAADDTHRYASLL